MPPLYWLGQQVFGVLFPICFRWRVQQRERVPTEGPIILASNHASYLDPPLVATASPRMCHCLARATLFTNPVGGWVLRQVGVLPVDRDGGSASGLRTFLGLLGKGKALFLFPEGTRTPDGRLQKPRSGLGLVVIKSGAPVVPVRIFGSFEAWGRHRKLPRFSRIIVKFGEPLRFDAQRFEAETCSRERLKEIYQEVTDEVMAAIGRIEPDETKTV